MFIISICLYDLMVLAKRITSFYFSSQMNGEEVFDAFNASGSADTKFSAGMLEHEDFKQENFDGLLATGLLYGWIKSLFEFF